MTRKEKYIKLCQREQIPIFSQYWWLDAVAGENNWDVAIVEKGGNIFASMPYYIEKKYGQTIIKHPKLTQTLGIHFNYPKNQKYYKKLSFEKEMITKLIEQLPKFDKFTKSFDYKTTNLLPFYWKGFNINIKYTYIIENLSNLEKVFSNFSPSAKKNINKAKKANIKIVDSNDIKQFYEINKITFDNQNLKIPYSIEFLKSFYNTLTKHNSCIMKFAMKDSKVYSVMLGVYDDKKLYMLLGSSDRRIQTYGAEYLLYWEMMKFASENKLIFDFEGSMIEGVETRNRSLGAIQKPYFQVSKINSNILKIKELLK